MSEQEFSGRTIDEAVAHGLEALGLQRDRVRIEVLQEPKPALLGFGGREARVRISSMPSPTDAVQAFVSTTLTLMGLESRAEAVDRGDAIAIEIHGTDSAELTDRQGKVLDAIELLASAHSQRDSSRRVPVIVDAAGYRAKHEEGLVAIALQAAERADREHVSVALAAMEARDRRVVHLTLKDDRRVHTVSAGEEDMRHVVVYPHGMLPEESSPSGEA